MLVDTPVLRRAFSLIELMIVIAILGVVAALAIPAYDSYIVRAKVSNMLTAGSAVQQAVTESRSTNGNFSDIVPSSSATTFTNIGVTDPTLLSPTISAVLFSVADQFHVAITLCGSTAGQGAPTAADTVDLYLVGTYYTSGMKWACQYTGDSSFVPASCRTLYDDATFGTLSTACPRVSPTPPY